ncbi:iron-containing alcohol dehydrogenase [Halobacillus shinanisalinarum]|uniref:Iron-containing alcohol dehydrogenase n=1 Tax=Halobacillus shinanisalinarum TaxID=2932258 RepID=A0ABY4GUW0_9BACI|nr:iron-containing alcohol dehydrogenase [Halobacillus shinanisalinarum]UOQ91913.1 iron-containing alcohol dehydrogenase [Halobacillus shinanisalinarum]
MNSFITPQNIYHGENSIKQLRTIVQDLKVRRAFVLTDPMLKELEVIQPIEKILKEEGIRYDLSTNVVPEPPLEIGNEVLQEIRENQPDLVLGIGGGSAMDLSKASAVLADHEGSVGDYLNLTGTKKLESPGIPTVLIPTTAGTGAEVTDISVFSLEGTKDVITHKYLLANYAIVDPQLTYTLPPKVTAASGVDALTHAIEAFTSVNATPLTDTLALDAMKRIVNNLRSAVWNPKAYYARKEMSLGSLIAGLSFYNAGVAGVHGLAYPLGGLFKIPHGEANAVLLPFVYHRIWPSCLEKMYALGEVFSVSYEGKDKRQVALEVIQALHELVKDVGLPTTISEYNITTDDIDQLTSNGNKQTRLLARSPMPFDENSIRNVYEHALRGWE